MTSEREWDWIDGFSRTLVHRAARRAPEALSERLEEEWLADMSERPGGFSRLRLAVGCYWATYAIAREHGVAALPATSRISKIGTGAQLRACLPPPGQSQIPR